MSNRSHKSRKNYGGNRKVSFKDRRNYISQLAKGNAKLYNTTEHEELKKLLASGPNPEYYPKKHVKSTYAAQRRAAKQRKLAK